METTAQAVIKEVASRLHSDLLKPRGFKKTAYTWIREDEWPKLINLQLSKWNSSEEARFTVNLGVFIPELHNAAGSYPVTGQPKEPDCDVRSRIGMLLPPGTDKWWEVSAASDEGKLFDEVIADLVEVGLPWLDRLHDYTTVAEVLIGQKNSFMAAIALKLDGRDNEAAEAMAAAHAKANKLALPKLKRIAEAQGIPTKG
jgi:hypothetical protein